MAIDRDTIVSLHKKVESNSTIAKELQIRRETVWKVGKKFRETGQTSNRPGQGRNRTVRTKWMVKGTREKVRTIPRLSATKLAAEAGIFLLLPGRLDVWPISLNFLTTIQTVSRRIWSFFAMVELLSPFL